MAGLDQTRRDELVQAALRARSRAHAPYSGFQVGAALLTATGRVFEGCNVENVSLGLTNCAERVAVGAAVAAGETRFVDIVIAASGDVTPCGACRQVLAEFCDDLPVLLVDADDPTRTRETTLAELLPLRFGLEWTTP